MVYIATNALSGFGLQSFSMSREGFLFGEWRWLALLRRKSIPYAHEAIAMSEPKCCNPPSASCSRTMRIETGVSMT